MEPIRSVLLHRLRPSPHNGQVGSCIISFVACSAFTHVTTYRLAKSPYATLYTGGSDGFVVSTAAPIATGRAIQFPGGPFIPPWTSAFHGTPLWPGYNTYFRLARHLGTTPAGSPVLLIKQGDRGKHRPENQTKAPLGDTMPARIARPANGKAHSEHTPSWR